MALKFRTHTDAVGTTGGKATIATLMPPLVEPVVEPEPQKVLVEPLSPTEQAHAEILAAEYIELWKKFEYFEVKALVKRMEEIRKTLVGVANETMDDKKPALFTCSKGTIEFSERGKEATVPNPLALIQQLLVKFGPEATASVVDIAITPLRKILSEHELQQHLVDVPATRRLLGVRPK